jgi:phospholipid/cholesterol/gamma-HCH transport system substrate-binding protein
MNRAYKFRYANEIAGGFVLLGISLLVLGIYLAGHAQGWFQKELHLKTKFNTKDGTYGLQEGAEVRILGALAGRVGEIVPADDGGMETVFVIKGRFGKFIRADSLAKVKKKFEVAGDAYVEITLGSMPQPLMRSGSYIQCVQDVELIEAARKMVDEFRAAAVPMLDEFRAILSHVNGITAQLEKKEGAAGKFIGDPALAATMEGIVNDIRKTSSQLPDVALRLEGVMTNVEAISASVSATAAGFPAISTGAGDVVKDFRSVTLSLTGQAANVEGVLLEAESALRQTRVLIEGLQKHWLVRRYIDEGGDSPMLDPLPAAMPKGRAP